MRTDIEHFITMIQVAPCPQAGHRLNRLHAAREADDNMPRSATHFCDDAFAHFRARYARARLASIRRFYFSRKAWPASRCITGHVSAMCQARHEQPRAHDECQP